MMRLETGDVARLVVGALRDAGDREAVQWTIDHHQSFLSACAQIADVVNRKRAARGRPAPEWPTAPAPVKTGWRLAIRNRAQVDWRDERGPVRVLGPSDTKPSGYNVVVEARSAFDAHALQRLRPVTTLWGVIAMLKAPYGKPGQFSAREVEARWDATKAHVADVFGPTKVLWTKDTFTSDTGRGPGVRWKYQESNIDFADYALGIWLQVVNAIAGTSLRAQAYEGVHEPVRLGYLDDDDGGFVYEDIEPAANIAVPRVVMTYLDDKLRGRLRESPNHGNEVDSSADTPIFQSIAQILDLLLFSYSSDCVVDTKRLEAEIEDDTPPDADIDYANREFSRRRDEQVLRGALQALREAAADLDTGYLLGREVLRLWSPVFAIDREKVPKAYEIAKALGAK